jgi:hypothetical protein
MTNVLIGRRRYEVAARTALPRSLASGGSSRLIVMSITGHLVICRTD